MINKCQNKLHISFNIVDQNQKKKKNKEICRQPNYKIQGNYN